jgi:hypothetical protein
MVSKGLCVTCAHDKNCVFQVRFPVLQCEEFANARQQVIKVRQPRQKQGKHWEEITVEE